MTSQERPVIGILAQEISRKVIPDSINSTSYISAAYVKHVEDAGADVVPIHTEWNFDELRSVFNSINGILLPGGGASLTDSKFMTNVRIIYEMAVNANENGDYFPIWGTCLGFEALLVLCGGESVLGDADAINLSMPTCFTDEANSSKVFSTADQQMINLFSTEPVKFHYHQKCVYKDTFLDSLEMTSQYSILCYDEDREKRRFVSLIEGKQHPFYGVQWHPEKVKHEMVPGLDVPKSAQAVAASEFFGEFFVSEAKKNRHKFSSLKEKEKYLIQNYDEVFTGEKGRIQFCYVF